MWVAKREDLTVSAPTWQPPGADDSGFVSLYSLAKHAGRLEPDQFAQAFPVPGLVVHFEGGTGNRQGTEKSDSGVQLLTVSMPSSGIFRYLNKVGFLCKRPGNPYAHLISIGRNHTNDIVLAVDSVSKVHGYFVEKAGSWSYTDRSSTNGSELDGQRLEPGVSAPVADGCRIKLGLDITIEVLEPPSLHTHLLKLL